MMIDISLLGFSMFVTAIVFAYIVLLLGIVLFIIDAAGEGMVLDFLFWLWLLLLFGGPGLAVAGLFV